MKYGIGCVDDNLLAGYLDGELHGDQLNEVEGHLACCPDCLDRLLEARSSMALEMVEAPSALRQKVKGLVPVPGTPAETWPWPWLELLFKPGRSMGLAMCSVMIVMACYMGMQFGQTICDGIWFSVEWGNTGSGGNL